MKYIGYFECEATQWCGHNLEYVRDWLRFRGCDTPVTPLPGHKLQFGTETLHCDDWFVSRGVEPIIAVQDRLFCQTCKPAKQL